MLVCQWRDVNGPNPDDSWLYEKRFCIESGACTADPAVYCAYNVDGPNAPLDAWEKYTAGGDAYGGGFAFWQGWCYETCPGPDGNHASGVYAGKRPSPSCGPEEVPYPYDGACSPEDDTGTPTTGTPTEGTGDPTSETGDDTDGGDTDTDGPFVETWLCSQFAAENCQTRTGNGINVDDEHCWSTSATPPTGRCVTAATAADAASGCECLCTMTNSSLTGGCETPGVCEVTPPGLDCSIPYPDSPVPLPSGYACEQGIYDAGIAAAMCPNNFKLFDASAALVLASSPSTNTAVAGIVGYLSYTVSNCNSTACDFSVDILVSPANDISGVYTQGTAVAGSYSIEDLSFEMMGRLEGVWRPSRGTITFGNDHFWATATMTGLTLDNAPLPASPLRFGTDQIVGRLSTRSPVLSLNFAFDVPGGTATFSLSTR